MKLRSALYAIARLLGDVQAVNQSVKKRSSAPVVRRVGRRIAGKLTGRAMGKLFPPVR